MPTTVTEILDQLPPDRRKAIDAMRKHVRRHLPKGYEEMAIGGMIMYSIPRKVYPKTYNGHPLAYVALASQKNYCSLYLMSAYSNPAHKSVLDAAFKAAGKKLDMGKSCVRFQTPDDLPLDAIGEVIASVPPEQWIAIYEASRKRTKSATR